MADIAELRGKSHDELREMAVSLKKDLFNLRFMAASGESPNTARFRQVRQDVARVKTLLNDSVGRRTQVSQAKKVEKKKAAGE
jgi:large subunit ribosomal protein L29